MGAILWWVIVGLVAGLLARWIFPGPREPRGVVMTIVLGILGAVVGGWLFTALGVGGYGFVGSVVVATVGALIVLWLYNVATRRA
jgi:uncharacterized membrane protein YeaQ/YmgE (transglycosylase-associated protein family)